MKKTISVAEAASYLQREFAKARPPGCMACAFPTPFWGPAVGVGPGYWYLQMPPPCPEKCQAVVALLWAGFMTEHEIQHMPYDSRTHRDQRALMARPSAPRSMALRRGPLARSAK